MTVFLEGGLARRSLGEVGSSATPRLCMGQWKVLCGVRSRGARPSTRASKRDPIGLRNDWHSSYANAMNTTPSFSAHWNVPAGSYFVTGTDTGVGKTWASAALVLAQRQAGINTGYMKPVQTGCYEEAGRRCAPDVEFVQSVTGCGPSHDLVEAICPYRFLLPASPHLAATQEQSTIQMDILLAAYERLAVAHTNLIVEGAGGIMVPLNKRELMLDLMKQLRLPVLVVSRAALGTLNHTLLTVNTIRDAGLDVAGMILVQSTPPAADAAAAHEEALILEDNQQTLELWSGIPILGRLPYQDVSEDPNQTRHRIEQIIAAHSQG